MQLGLGTAQFGSAYGITNNHGQLSERNALQILRAADSAGARVIDTAAAYGDAEQVLGRLLWRGHPFRVITKTQPIEAATVSKRDVTYACDGFKRSLERLGLPCVAGLLLHHGAELLRPGGELLAEMLCDLKSAGLVERIGMSCYGPAELRDAARILRPDLVQVPVNVLDRRFLNDGILAELKLTGTEVHARSAFLQGLLLAPSHSLPATFNKHRHAFEKLEAYAFTHGLTSLEVAIGFLETCTDLDVTLVGVTCVTELENIVEAWQAMGPRTIACPDLGYDDETLLIPSRWRATPSQGTGP